jgi:hypothetical protein
MCRTQSNRLQVHFVRLGNINTKISTVHCEVRNVSFNRSPLFLLPVIPHPNKDPQRISTDIPRKLNALRNARCK